MQSVPRMCCTAVSLNPPMSDGYKAWEQSTLKASGKHFLMECFILEVKNEQRTQAQIITLTEIQTQAICMYTAAMN